MSRPTEDDRLRLVRHDLFGGGLSCPIIDGFHDVSNVRPVPDHQEVFVSSKETDDHDDVVSSLIVEILSDDFFSSDEFAAPELHFADLARANDAEAFSVLKTVSAALDLEGYSERETREAFGGRSFCSVTVGLQRAQNRTGRVLNDVMILLACIRLEKQRTDILVTLNLPGEEGHQADQKTVQTAAARLGAYIHAELKYQTSEVRDAFGKDSLEFMGALTVRRLQYLQSFFELVKGFKVEQLSLFDA